MNTVGKPLPPPEQVRYSLLRNGSVYLSWDTPRECEEHVDFGGAEIQRQTLGEWVSFGVFRVRNEFTDIGRSWEDSQYRVRHVPTTFLAVEYMTPSVWVLAERKDNL